VIQFQVGDQVRVVGLPPSEWRDAVGVVVETVEKQTEDLFTSSASGSFCRQLLRVPGFLEAQHLCHTVVGLMSADVLRTGEHKFCKRCELLTAFGSIQREQDR